jgi:hypothetical protein
MILGVSALCYLLRVKQGYKRITGGVLYGLIQSPNQTVIQCLTPSLACMLLTIQTEGRSLPPWLLALGGQHKVAINLLLWRPFTSSMISSRRGDPSGLVPSLTIGFHGSMRRERDGDRAGPRRVFIISSNLQDLVVSFNLFRILF